MRKECATFAGKLLVKYAVYTMFTYPNADTWFKTLKIGKNIIIVIQCIVYDLSMSFKFTSRK